MEHQTEKNHLIPTRIYLLVWIALLTLTGVTVLAAGIHMGRWSMAANLFIASSKATLVIWFFMHLKYETKFFRLMFLIPIATITIIIWLTFYDIWYR